MSHADVTQHLLTNTADCSCQPLRTPIPSTYMCTGFAGEVQNGLLLHPDGHTLIYPLVQYSTVRTPAPHVVVALRRPLDSFEPTGQLGTALQGSTIVLRDKQDSSAQEFLQVRPTVAWGVGAANSRLSAH